MYKKVCIFLAVVLSSFAQNFCSLPGTLDKTFHAVGIQPGTVVTTIEHRSGNDFGQSVAQQADGKIIVAGYSTVSNGFAVARFNTDGTLDKTFNASGNQPGTVTTLVDNEPASGYAVAIQSDGKIVVAGYTNASNKFAVARFNTDGTLDTAFNALGGQRGTVTALVDNEPASGYAVAIQTDGKIVVAGSTNVSGRVAVARFNTNGTPDLTFNSLGDQPGTLAILIANEPASGYSVAIQTDNKIVVAGHTNVSRKFAVARLNSNGTLDVTFNVSGPQLGTVATMVDGESALGYSVAIQTDNKIVVAGYTNVSNKFAVARFNTDGTLDAAAFNASGSQPGTVATLVNNESVLGYSVAIQQDDKIVVAGRTNTSGRFAIARFNTNGTLDTAGFNASGDQPGTAITQVEERAAFGYSVAVQQDSKLIIAGSVFVSGIDEFAVARFGVNGTLDTSFNSAGTQPGTVATTIDNLTIDDKGYSVALQSDGKIVVAGYALFGSVNKFAAARFDANGILDSTFNASGVQPGTVSTTIDNGVVDNEGYSVAVQPDGKIVIAGFAKISGVNRFAVARFTTNGTLDTTFNASGAQPGTVSTTIDHSL
jgi:uncharacterized delta-60 repeat protein